MKTMLTIIGCVLIGGLALAQSDSRPGDSGMDAVERHIDRGSGRVVDQQTYEIQQMRIDRDPRTGDTLERIDAEEDRRRRLEQQGGAAKPQAAGDDGRPIVNEEDHSTAAWLLARGRVRDALKREILDAVERRDRALRHVLENEVETRQQIDRMFDNELEGILGKYWLLMRGESPTTMPVP